MRQRKQITSVFVLALLAAAAGCGGSKNAAPNGAPQTAAPGGGTTAGAGRLQLSVRWAQRARAVPAAAQSIKVELTDGAAFSTSRVVDRPAGGSFSTIDFADLPLGELMITVTAYPESGAAGTPLAGATLVATVVAGQSATVSVNVESTIDHLVMAAFSPYVHKNATLNLTATPVDASGAVVPVAPGGIAWVSDDPSLATVDANGVVTGVAAGSLTVKAVERESGKYAIANLTIRPDTGGLALTLVDPTISVAVTPLEVTLAPGATQQFRATVTGSPNPFVAWSVQEAGGGTITSHGLYTAPLALSTYHVIATSVADPSRSATAAITVAMGGRIAFEHDGDIYVLYNNADVDGDALVVIAATQGADGTTTVNADNTITYTPRSGFAGDDSFTYTVSDPDGMADTATVFMSVTRPNLPPIALNDTATASPGLAVVIPVLANDNDPDGDTLALRRHHSARQRHGDGERGRHGNLPAERHLPGEGHVHLHHQRRPWRHGHRPGERPGALTGDGEP